MTQRIHVEQLLGKKVFDPAGRFAGRIEELQAHQTADGDCIVDAYLLGQWGLAERLSVPGAAHSLLTLLGAYGRPLHCKVPWQQMDLSNPLHPRLRVPLVQLPEG